MGVGYTERLVKDITAATEFKTMKATKYDTQERNLRAKFGENFTMYRKGDVIDQLSIYDIFASNNAGLKWMYIQLQDSWVFPNATGKQNQNVQPSIWQSCTYICDYNTSLIYMSCAF